MENTKCFISVNVYNVYGNKVEETDIFVGAGGELSVPTLALAMGFETSPSTKAWADGIGLDPRPAPDGDMVRAGEFCKIYL